MKKSIVSLFLLFSLSNAAGTYDGISFTDSEEQIGLYLCNYMPYQDFINLSFSSNNANSVVTGRSYATFLDCSNNSGMTSTTTKRLWEHTHYVDLRLLTNNLGLSYRDSYFLSGLAGLLIGFSFFLLIGYMAIRIARRRF